MHETHVYTIKEVNKYIRMKMDSDPVLSDVWLRGEISNYTHHSSGHMYFTLKDKDSRIKCVMFASHNARLKFIPREGTKVIARGMVTVFERDGAYQFYANAMQPDGLGSLYLAYEQLKARLEEEGLFAQSRKRALPLFPHIVGVVTSPTGAAVRDIVTTIQRRYPLANVLLAPVQVQGELAAPSIVKAIQYMNEQQCCDVLIVGRGGGSLEELWAFNEEAVVRAIAASAIPVISAVGHETDFTLSDFAADVRAATPTAAAELAVPSLQEVAARVRHQQEKLNYRLTNHIKGLKHRLAKAEASGVLRDPRKLLLQRAERIDYLQISLKSRLMDKLNGYKLKLSSTQNKLTRIHPENRIRLSSRQVLFMQTQLSEQLKKIVAKKTFQFMSSTKQLDALSPLKVMARGYNVAYNSEQQLIRSVKQVEKGSKLELKVADGTLACEVIDIKEGKQ